MDLLQQAVADRIQTTTQQLAATTTTTTVKADQLDALSTRFYGIAARSHRLGLLAKAHYPSVYQTMQQTLASCRLSLLHKVVQQHMDDLLKEHGPVGMTRLASVFLRRLCASETALYQEFFDDTKASEGYLTTLCSTLHRTVRRSLVTLRDLDTLCQMVRVLREELSQATTSASALSSVIQDAQERLIFCANATLNKDIVRYKATPQDLDYPNKLKQVDDDPLERVYATWFPPVRTTVQLLSKLFRVVDSHVFEDLALRAVQGCTRCLKDAAKYLQQKHGGGVLDADLFGVRHWLILREQLSPFDVELRSVEKHLDFSEAGQAVARFWAKSWRTENALWKLLKEGVSVQESSVDSKRDLEEALRSACNDLMEHVAQAAAGPLLQVVQDCQNAESAAVAKEEYLNSLDLSDMKLEESLEATVQQMSLYLDHGATRMILLKPIAKKILRAAEQVRQLSGGGSLEPQLDEVDAIVQRVLLSSSSSKK